MPVVWIPSLVRDVTGGRERVEAEGQTLRDVLDKVEVAYPGFRDRVCEEGRIRPGLAVAVDGEVTDGGLRQELEPHSEIHFIAAVSGGR